MKLGRTGLDVSPLAIGCMSCGDPGRGNHPWSLDEEASRPLIRQALDRTQGTVTHAAELLGLRRTTLIEKIRKHGLDQA